MNHENFLKLLLKLSNGVREEYQEVHAEWLPEEPPITILYAALGHRIAEEFSHADVAATHQIFSLIEEAMQSSNENLITAVATGLIEALVTRAVEIEGLWEQIKPLLGPRSLRHANAWLFT